MRGYCGNEARNGSRIWTILVTVINIDLPLYHMFFAHADLLSAHVFSPLPGACPKMANAVVGAWTTRAREHMDAVNMLRSSLLAARYTGMGQEQTEEPLKYRYVTFTPRHPHRQKIKRVLQ